MTIQQLDQQRHNLACKPTTTLTTVNKHSHIEVRNGLIQPFLTSDIVKQFLRHRSISTPQQSLRYKTIAVPQSIGRSRTEPAADSNFLNTSSAVPTLDYSVPLIHRQHRIMSCIQPKQFSHMRVHAQPASRQNTQHMRMRNK